MNPDWINFLQENGAQLDGDLEIAFPRTDRSVTTTIYPVTHLSIFSVSGDDAADFLQGQFTCDIREVRNDRASLAAYCNAKGRVISSLLVCRKDDGYLVVLPRSLLNKVMSKLRLYIMRSKVQLLDRSDRLCLIGLSNAESGLEFPDLPEAPYAAIQNDLLFVKLPGATARFLCIGEPESAKALWSRTVGRQFAVPGNSQDWSLKDLSAGIPWFDEAASEHYIPQMLNIDKLGGISFNKGCYVGQEIVARTHYLGKAKREMVLAQCALSAEIDAETTVVDKDSREPVGHIAAYRHAHSSCRMLVVVQLEGKQRPGLMLSNGGQEIVEILPFE